MTEREQFRGKRKRGPSKRSGNGGSGQLSAPIGAEQALGAGEASLHSEDVIGEDLEFLKPGLENDDPEVAQNNLNNFVQAGAEFNKVYNAAWEREYNARHAEELSVSGSESKAHAAAKKHLQDSNVQEKIKNEAHDAVAGELHEIAPGFVTLDPEHENYPEEYGKVYNNLESGIENMPVEVIAAAHRPDDEIEEKPALPPAEQTLAVAGTEEGVSAPDVENGSTGEETGASSEETEESVPANEEKTFAEKLLAYEKNNNPNEENSELDEAREHLVELTQKMREGKLFRKGSFLKKYEAAKKKYEELAEKYSKEAAGAVASQENLSDEEKAALEKEALQREDGRLIKREVEEYLEDQNKQAKSKVQRALEWYGSKSTAFKVTTALGAGAGVAVVTFGSLGLGGAVAGAAVGAGRGFGFSYFDSKANKAAQKAKFNEGLSDEQRERKIFDEASLHIRRDIMDKNAGAMHENAGKFELGDQEYRKAFDAGTKEKRKTFGSAAVGAAIGGSLGALIQANTNISENIGNNMGTLSDRIGDGYNWTSDKAGDLWGNFWNGEGGEAVRDAGGTAANAAKDAGNAVGDAFSGEQGGEYSEAARTIQNGEGFYQTFQEMGIPQSEWADTLQAAGPELNEVTYEGTNTPVSYYDDAAQEWRLNMSPNGMMPAEALNVIQESAGSAAETATDAGGGAEQTGDGANSLNATVDNFNQWLDQQTPGPGYEVQKGDTLWDLSGEHHEATTGETPTLVEQDHIEDHVLEHYQDTGQVGENGWLYTGDTLETAHSGGETSGDSAGGENAGNNANTGENQGAEQGGQQAEQQQGAGGEGAPADTGADASGETGAESQTGGDTLAEQGVFINGNSISIGPDGNGVQIADISDQLDARFGVDLSAVEWATIFSELRPDATAGVHPNDELPSGFTVSANQMSLENYIQQRATDLTGEPAL